MTLQSEKYLYDILYAIELIEEFVSEISSFSDYSNDKKTSSAVERQLAIIGEAVNKFDKLNLDKQLKNTTGIISLRNRIVHAYDNIDDTVIWAIIKRHLPALKEEIKDKIKQ